MNIFISQPMTGRTNDEIVEERNAILDFARMKYVGSNAGENHVSINDADSDDCLTVADDDSDSDNGVNGVLRILDTYFGREYKGESFLVFLGRSIEMLAEADVAIFAAGWEKSKGCRIEHVCCLEYGIEILEM